MQATARTAIAIAVIRSIGARRVGAVARARTYLTGPGRTPRGSMDGSVRCGAHP
jgi:hypothetical protein